MIFAATILIIQVLCLVYRNLLLIFADIKFPQNYEKMFSLFHQVFLQMRGTKGKLAKQHLSKNALEDSVAALNGEHSVFRFSPGSTENFSVRGTDIGELVAIEVEVLYAFFF